MGRFAPCKLAKLLHAPSEPVGKKFGTNAAASHDSRTRKRYDIGNRRTSRTVLGNADQLCHG
jgi:hypothetical protein